MAFTFYYDTDEAGKSKIGYRNGRGLTRRPDWEALDSGMNGEWVPGMAAIFDLDEFESNQYWSGLVGYRGVPGHWAGIPERLPEIRADPCRAVSVCFYGWFSLDLASGSAEAVSLLSGGSKDRTCPFSWM